MQVSKRFGLKEDRKVVLLLKQVVITAPREFEVQEVEVPEPKAGEVLVQMKAAGVCGSDFHLFLGENPNAKYPRVPGHENAGIVTKVGEGVTTVQEGDHVVVDLVVSCGHCKQCLSGRKNICREVRSRGASIDGGWREYFVVKDREVYAVPKEIPFRDAALVEPFAIGGHCAKRGRVTKDDTVLVYGSGTIGAIILQTCKSIGATVISCDISPMMLERAKAYGADYTIHSKEENLLERVQEITGGAGVDVVFDSACYPGSLTLLMTPGIIGNGGRMVPLGFVTEEEGLTQAMINIRELDIIGTRMSAHQFEPAIEKMREKTITIEGIVSDYIPFSQIEKVFENIQNPPAGLKKMVIVFDE